MNIWERVIRTVYFGKKATSESYIRYLRKKGVQIGAGSVVKGNIPPGSVAAGNPCRKITDLETFYNKRKLRQKEEAALLANAYYASTGKAPTPYVLREFTGLYAQNMQDQPGDTAMYLSYQSLLDDILAKEDR